MMRIELLPDDPRLGRYLPDGGIEWPAMDINGRDFDRRVEPVEATLAVGGDRFVIVPRKFQDEVVLKAAGFRAAAPADTAADAKSSRGKQSNADE